MIQVKVVRTSPTEPGQPRNGPCIITTPFIFSFVIVGTPSLQLAVVTRFNHFTSVCTTECNDKRHQRSLNVTVGSLVRNLAEICAGNSHNEPPSIENNFRLCFLSHWSMESLRKSSIPLLTEPILNVWLF